MLNKIITGLLVLAASGCALQAQQQPDAAQVYAWYREDGIQTRGNTVTAWTSATGSGAGGGRALNQVVGAPCAVRVKTPGGEKNILSFDGSSALWARSDRWKEITGDLTIVALLRLRSTEDGFLFDGSTGAGLTRAQVRGGQWQIGVQPIVGSATGVAGNVDDNTVAAQRGVWQTHAFVFRKANGTATHNTGGTVKTVTLKSASPLAGFIIGANSAAKIGLRADVAEMLVYDRALTGEQVDVASKYLSGKWGTLETVTSEGGAETDKAAISAKLTDKSKPLIWLWSGQSTLKASDATRSRTQHFAERVRWELGRRRDIVIDTRTTETTLGALEKNFEARIARFRPAVVVLQLTEGDNASSLLSKVRKLGAIPVLQMGTQPSAALRKTAADEGVILVEASSSANSATQTEAGNAATLLRTLGIDNPKSG